MKRIQMIKVTVDLLYRIRNEHFDEKRQCIGKFEILLNEYNVIQLINDIEKKLKEKSGGK